MSETGLYEDCLDDSVTRLPGVVFVRRSGLSDDMGTEVLIVSVPGGCGVGMRVSVR